MHENETILLVETDNGKLMSVPESKLKEWAKAQEKKRKSAQKKARSKLRTEEFVNQADSVQS